MALLKEKYKFLDHPGDVKLRAHGKTLAEVFVNAALGMADYIFGKEVFKKKKTLKETITLAAQDRESLLVDFLSHILYLTATNHRAYTFFFVREARDTKLIAEAWGVSADAVRDIKAVTYNELSVKKNGSIWEATVVFDL